MKGGGVALLGKAPFVLAGVMLGVLLGQSMPDTAHAKCLQAKQQLEGRLEALQAARAKGAGSVEADDAGGVYGLSADDLSGHPVALSRFKGKVLLVTNVASR